jgi:hypothetical protein
MTEADAPLLGRADLERALTLLGERLARRGVVADIYVVGDFFRDEVMSERARRALAELFAD